MAKPDKYQPGEKEQAFLEPVTKGKSEQQIITEVKKLIERKVVILSRIPEAGLFQ